MVASISSKNERKLVNLRFHSSKVEFFRLFFWGYVGLKKSFRLCLTFEIGLSNFAWIISKLHNLPYHIIVSIVLSFLQIFYQLNLFLASNFLTVSHIAMRKLHVLSQNSIKIFFCMVHVYFVYICSVAILKQTNQILCVCST